MSARFVVGIDTGGTYTDAAVLNAADHAVVARAKALTTREDLALGVNAALTAALQSMPQDAVSGDIDLVSVSTTLATNAVVEGHGSPVAVVLIGFDDTMVRKSGIEAAFPGIAVVRISGGHDHNGAAVAALDVDGLRQSVTAVAPKVEAFAVAGRFGVRNPEHEQAARDAIIAAAGKPVTLSSELSSDLDAPRRALTAVLNARLISKISILVDAVRQAMAERGVEAPLMVVKGDGSLALADTVALRPIETILSGPAASLVGAAALSGRKDFILSDMGGTTSDLGMLRNGRPVVSSLGAEVGGWRTMVKAMDVHTLGLGGDSEVAIDYSGRLAVGPRRLIPVSLLATQFPEVPAILEAELSEPQSSAKGRLVLLTDRGGGAAGPPAGLSSRETGLLERIGPRPQALSKVAPSSGLERVLAKLQRKGIVQVAGFTPSDAAHVLDMQDNWSREAALLGARAMTRLRDETAPDDAAVMQFCRDVWDEVVTLSGKAVIGLALGDAGDAAGAGLVDAVCRGAGRLGGVQVLLTPELPVVAVGGPVKVYYPEVGRRLGAEVVFSTDCDVANAVGAACGVVVRAVAIEVVGNGSGAFKVMGPTGPQTFARAGAAIAAARTLAEDLARDDAVAMGAHEPELHVSVVRQLMPDAVAEDDILAAQVRVEAVGRPHLA